MPGVVFDILVECAQRRCAGLDTATSRSPSTSSTSSIVISTGLSPRISRPSAMPPEIIDQRDIELGFQRAIRTAAMRARADRELGRERLDDAAVGEMRADGAADAAMKLARVIPRSPAERFQRAGKILVRPQPQREGAAGCCPHRSARARHRPEQFEIGLGVRLGR